MYERMSQIQNIFSPQGKLLLDIKGLNLPPLLLCKGRLYPQLDHSVFALEFLNLVKKTNGDVQPAIIMVARIPAGDKKGLEAALNTGIAKLSLLFDESVLA